MRALGVVCCVGIVVAGCSVGSQMREKKELIHQECPPLSQVPYFTPEEQKERQQKMHKLYKSERKRLEKERSCLKKISS